MIGYNSNGTTWANNAVDDMFNRGFDGFIADVMGGDNNCGYPNFTSPCSGSDHGNAAKDDYFLRDAATSSLRNRILAHPTMQYALMEDQAAFLYDDNCGPVSSQSDYPKCIELKLESDLNYYNTTYFSDSQYLRDPATGQPVVLFFVDKPDFGQCTQQNVCQLAERTCFVSPANPAVDCWQGIWDGVRNSGIAARLIFENDNGVDGGHPDTDGGFAWVTPNNASGNGNVTTTTQLDWGKSYLDDFYATANANHASIVFGSAYKGYDEENAPFHNSTPPNPTPDLRVMAQQCGQVWLNSFAEVTHSYNSGNQIPYMMVATWDDYEEGSEIETGIDNCVNDNSFNVSLNGNTLSWSFQFSDSTYGTPNTIDHYILFYTTDGTNLFAKDSNISPGNCSFTSPTVSCSINLTSYTWSPGNYTLYVKAVGKPSITNHFSTNSVSYVVGGPALSVSPSSINFGSEPVGQTSSPQILTLTSTGTQPVTVSSFSVSGDFGWNISGLSNPCPAPPFNLSTSTSCTVNVTFTPTQSGSRSGTFTIQDNAPGNPHLVSLSGTGGSGSCPANTICNIDAMAGWFHESGSASSSLTQGVSSPSLDGGSAQFSMFDPTAYAGSKWENKLGANDSASHFTLDLEVYLQNPSVVQAANFGISQMYAGGDYAFHFECDLRGNTHWNVWIPTSNSWSDTGIVCSIAANTWTHLTFDVQRVNGQLQYNWVKVNGTQYNINQTWNPSSESPDNVEVGIQLYEDSTADAFSMWIDSMNLTEQ